MQKLYTTTSKDDYAILLDILEIQGIYEEHTVTLNDRSENQYTVFVNEEDFEKAKQILDEQEFEGEEQDLEAGEGKEYDYSDYDNEDLINALIYLEKDEEHRREKLMAVLAERGIDKTSIEEKIVEEINEEYEQEKLSIFDILLTLLTSLAFGIFTIKEGYKIYTSKYVHSVTGEKFYTYDDYSRNVGLGLLIIGVIVGVFEIIYFGSIFL